MRPFANGGAAVMPYAILDITDRQGAVLYTREDGGLGQVITPDTVQTMNRMMTQVITRGTGTAAAFGFPAAGKTGTRAPRFPRRRLVHGLHRRLRDRRLGGKRQ